MANFVEVQEEPIDFLKVLSLATDGKFGAISTFFGISYNLNSLLHFYS